MRNFGQFWVFFFLRIYALFGVFFTSLNNVVVYQNGQIWGMGFDKPVNSTRLWALLDFLSSWNLRKRNCDQKCDLMDWRQLESVCNHLTIKVKCKGDTLLMLQQLFIFGSWKKSLQERDENAFDLIDLLSHLHLLPCQRNPFLIIFLNVGCHTSLSYVKMFVIIMIESDT